MPKDYIPVALKRLVFDRANGCCEYCRSQAKFAIESLVIEHIIPTSRGGDTSAANLALACQGCNNYKYNKVEGLDPIAAQPAALFDPRTMSWSDHLAWNEDTTLAGWLNAHRSCDRKHLAVEPGRSRQFASGAASYRTTSTRLTLTFNRIQDFKAIVFYRFYFLRDLPMD